MGSLWTLLAHLYNLAGPAITLIYPLYASIRAMESSAKLDDEQWLAYWILYSFFTLMEMAAESILYWIPIWYEIKLVLVAWLVLPQFRGAAFVYEKFVREKLRSLMEDQQQTLANSSSPKDIKASRDKMKNKFAASVLRLRRSRAKQ